jgi:hypothetical protein
MCTIKQNTLFLDLGTKLVELGENFIIASYGAVSSRWVF